MLLRKESWVAMYQKTEQGREILKDLWRLQQTGADETAIRRFESR
nr:MAG TPA: hypothetical protein [Caudoviricetes sp.]